METISIQVFVKPNAKKTVLLNVVNGAIHIALKARPQENAANEELCRFIAELFEIPKTQVEIYRGQKSRHKSLRVPKSKEILEKLSSI